MKDKYFIYTGNSYPHKNINRLIDAIVLANIKLKIVSGRSAFVERLEKQIKNKKAESLVEILGFMPDSKLRTLYKNSVAFVYPTLSEGFGLPPKEAIDADTIAIVSNIPVLKEVYKNSVDYFNPTDVESIANALKKALKISARERSKKIRYAQNFLKQYSWKKMAEETLNIYKSVV